MDDTEGCGRRGTSKTADVYDRDLGYSSETVRAGTVRGYQSKTVVQVVLVLKEGLPWYCPTANPLF